MIDADRRRLAERLRGTWPNGALWQVWYDALATLEHEPAERAYRSLRETEHKPPSVARFLVEYRRYTSPEATDGCTLCDGTGYVPVKPLVVVGRTGEVLHEYTRVTPCTCPRGRAVWAGSA